MLCACAATTSENIERHPQTVAQIDSLVNSTLSWHIPPYTQNLAGLTLLHDGGPFAHRNLAVARSVERSNHRIAYFDALALADQAVTEADKSGISAEFFCAMILQESAFDPLALSSAGAVGIAQFTLDTADASGVDPFNAADALRGSASLIAAYVASYRGRYSDPYAAALAAYNAGPGAVSAYHGVPPYAETHEYISDIYERWARILSEER